MLDLSAFFATLDAEGLGSWAAPLEPVIVDRIADHAHGNLRDWRNSLDSLPQIERQRLEVRSGAVATPADAISDTQRAAIHDALLQLRPWRKGPFRIGNVHIDAEWRSDLKWERIVASISPLHDRRVLDVGCGNGYYALRMRHAGARAVIGIDPTLLYVVQFLALCHFFDSQPVHILPLRMEELPADSRTFDTVFSMGVLYHQRAPIDHLRQLRNALRPGGELVLETLILPGSEALSRTPENRYARMRNVWHLPSATELRIWLQRAGFMDIRLCDQSLTTSAEQRSTEWMPFESLAEALDAQNPEFTVEGWPAPLRAVFIGRCPS